jgi:phage/plasmid primase-like uncharacterized protein
MSATISPREIAALVPMGHLLKALGFAVNQRARRGPCLLHSGSNPTAFAWREDGRWHCFSCGAGGDKIALVRAVHKCSFREAVTLLAAMAGVEFRLRRVSQWEIAQAQWQRERAERSAWRIVDKIARLRRYYTNTLHRAERLQTRIGGEILHAYAETARDRDRGWERLARLAPVCTFFFAGWNFIWEATPDVLVRFALASPTERRRLIRDGVAP